MEAQEVFGAMRPPPHQTSLINGIISATQITTQESLSYNNRCNPNSFSNLSLFGAQILKIDAVPLSVSTSLIDTSPSGFTSPGSYYNLNICNITVTYTHPGQNDSINIGAWLPFLSEDWNGRFLASGGGGWLTGYPASHHAPIVEQGFATASTDGGHDVYSSSSKGWALKSEGNVDWNMLSNFASVALNDLAVIGKQVTEMYYEKRASHSYWAGCSTGGRQGLMLAQRYPKVFDGILAIAPAINWVRFIVAEFWAQHVMNRLGYWPLSEELDAITEAAIEACDELDGVKDGIISLPGVCEYDAMSAVGTVYTNRHTGEEHRITEEAAMIANEAWRGPRSPNGRYDWYGLTHDTPLTKGLVNTDCHNGSASSCKGAAFLIAEEWLKYFIAKGDPNLDLTALSDEEYFSLFHKSIQEYESIIGTSDPDLSAFREHGGKMITWHGLADQLIFPNGTVDYYKRVLELDPEAKDFYRYFEAPGVYHCTGGPGPMPVDALQALMDWVEEGVVPETLAAKTQYGDGRAEMERSLCAWPKEQRYRGGDPNVMGSFECI